MISTNCLTANQLAIGMRYEKTFSFSHEDVVQYCRLASDYNAIHHRIEAAQLRFPGVKDIVVPGGLIQIAITGILGTSFPGDGSLGLTFSPERFRKPVCPNDEVSVVLEITRMRAEIVEIQIEIHNAEGIVIGNATARTLAPDNAYQQWWEAHTNAK